MLDQLNGQIVLITGASTGIGLEFAKIAARYGARTLMVARDIKRLEQAACAIVGTHAPQLFVVDLSNAIEVEELIAKLDRGGLAPDMLINNAGAGASGDFVSDKWPKLDAMMRLNMNALAHLSHWAAGRMVKKGRGAIINLSAAVATRPTPYFGAYAATKAFVTSLSQAMSAELKDKGVSVTVVHPPAVKTSFADADKADLHSTLVMKFPAVSATYVARAALKAALRGRRSIMVGPIAAVIMATAPIMPRSLDLAFMGLLFRGKRTSS